MLPSFHSELDFNPFMRVIYKVITPMNEQGAAEAELRVSAHEDGPPLHFHPAQEEGFRVVSGTLDFFIHGSWSKIEAGDSIIVPPNTAHTFKNATADEIVFINTHKPALNFIPFMEKFHRLIHSGKLNRKVNLSTLIYLSILWIDHEKDLVSVKPPKVMMRILAWIGKLLRYRVD